MSLAKQNPTEERVVIAVGSLPHEVSQAQAYRGLISNAEGTVTLQNEERESAAITIPVVKGINPHVFNKVTSVSGVTMLVGYR